MRAIIRFLYGLRLVFLFLLLETIAVVLIIKQNAYHRASFFNSSNAVSGRFYAKIADANYYLSLRQVNDSLAAEISRLQNQLPRFQRVDSSNWLVSDSTSFTPTYTFTPARVVNNTIGYRSNFLTLDKGTLAGIEPRMAVVGMNGIVGIVKDVSEHYATVISVLNKNTRISAKHSISGATGTVVWNGLNYRKAQLIEIPTHIDLAEGDSVTTSAFSNIFPENLHIGRIVSIEKPEGSSTYMVDIELGTDYNRLSFVQVIGNRLQAERDSLEGGLIYE
jgi:rod shape-determining protein MreC